ncbi:pirin family protein [Marinicrinis sediminis]|uniref:Pirin family protein n=1 Tax=Marinicrinis sediminis TaxID=1652465 RepID=A0ABW5R9Q8_9BACL
MSIRIYPKHLQGVGQFDGGAIVEQKPIGFPGEGSVVKRVGPLFYWAWFRAESEGHIPMHPHHGFEIMTYVIKGKAAHQDSLGTRSTVQAGGVQLMQTGSGVEHEERMIGPEMEGFQIWFEPNLEKTVHHPPTYRQFEHDDFPRLQHEGVTVKEVLGDNSPAQLEVPAVMKDVELGEQAIWRYPLSKGKAVAGLLLEGEAQVYTQMSEERDTHRNPSNAQMQAGDFLVYEADGEMELVFQAASTKPVRLIVIKVPAQVDYRLYPKR